MGATFTSYFSLYKEQYWSKGIQDLFFETDKMSSPILASMEAKSIDNGMGRKFVVPVEYLAGSSVSADFATAQAKAQGATVGSGTGNTRWEVDATMMEGVAVWTREAILAAEGGTPAQAVDVIDREMRSKVAVMKRRLAIASVEQGFGRVGTITAVTTSSITVGTDVVNRIFEGDDLVASLTVSANVLKNSGTSIIVTSVNYETGVVGLGSDPTAGTAWAIGDTVFQKGDRQNSATPSRIVAAGLAAWLPSAAPTSTAFFGVDRTLSLSTLASQRFDATGLDHSQAFIRGIERLTKNTGTRPSVLFCSSEDYATLCADRDATKIVAIELGKYKVGFSGVTVQTYAGNIPVIPDVYIPQGTAYVGPFDDARYAPFIAHNRDLVNIDNEDGRDFLRLAGSTSFETRLFFRGNIIVPAPGKFMTISNLAA